MEMVCHEFIKWCHDIHVNCAPLKKIGSTLIYIGYIDPKLYRSLDN